MTKEGYVQQMEIKPGYKYHYQRPAVSNKMIHVIAIIEKQAVFCWYSYVRKYWQFQIEWVEILKDRVKDKGKSPYEFDISIPKKEVKHGRTNWT